MSAYAWHAVWREGGSVALTSGRPGRAWRTEDQRWILARVAKLIHRLFDYRHTPRGESYLLHRLGWSPQLPVRRAVESCRTEPWPRVRGRPGSRARVWPSRTKPGRT
ncbi:winged helix-turn-helix domain-containing protein [Streptomyces sp. NPDC059169]|uniref:helix-turn-helix domain-containing protein n=1 Tax=Streptomyces sp. NPDC059169 TaxID=3346754 RepID=UPI0036B2C5FC